MQKLNQYKTPKNWTPGRNFTTRFLWRCFGLVLVSSFIPGTHWRKIVLRLFGARIGKGGVLKPYIHITAPWRLIIGDYCWIGEKTWIDNIEMVTIHNNVCISQLVYICTGNHNYKSKEFDLISKSVEINEGAWIGASSLISPGTKINKNVVILMGSKVSGDLKEDSIVGGNPHKFLKKRIFN